MNKKTVRIPNRVDPTSACWEGEIEDTGSLFKNLGEAVKVALKMGAYLQGADLRGADLQGAYLQGADLQGAKSADLAIAMTRILPEGSLIGWKKLRGGIIAKLRIPEDAKRSHAFGRKCRAEFAEVLELLNSDGSKAGAGISQHDSSFVYRVGDTVRPMCPFSENWVEECESGIHFFITKLEAENY